jgi:hypothetical protein
MARAKDVQPGQVWKAKVSGKLTNVEVMEEIPPTASGRRRWRWKNLATGRSAKGTAAKLRELVSEAPASTPYPPPGAAEPPPRPKPRRKRGRKKPPAPAVWREGDPDPFEFGQTDPFPEVAKVYFPNLAKTLSVVVNEETAPVLRQLKRDRGIYYAGWRSAEEALRPHVVERHNPCLPCVPPAALAAGGALLGSLRGNLPRPNPLPPVVPPSPSLPPFFTNRPRRAPRAHPPYRHRPYGPGYGGY